MCCCKRGNFLDVENLLASGVDSTVCDSSGRDALFYALQENRKDIVQLIQYWQVDLIQNIFFFFFFFLKKKFFFIFFKFKIKNYFFFGQTYYTINVSVSKGKC
jgi:hypothetical protein